MGKDYKNDSHMRDVAEWEAKAGTPKGDSSGNYNNYSPKKNNGCWSIFFKILLWIVIIIVLLILSIWTGIVK